MSAFRREGAWTSVRWVQPFERYNCGKNTKALIIRTIHTNASIGRPRRNSQISGRMNACHAKPRFENVEARASVAIDAKCQAVPSVPKDACGRELRACSLASRRLP